MDKETLSNYGWITIVTLVLAVMLALATPFGNYVGNGVVSIARGYVDTSEKKMSEQEVNKVSKDFNDKFDGTYGKTPCELNGHKETYGGKSGAHMICSVCKKVLSTTHEYTDTVTTKPMCTTSGVVTHQCKCGYKTTSFISPTGHHFSTVSLISPNCTTNGRETLRCANQNCGYEQVNTIQALGHKYAVSEVIPTCTTQGERIYNCVRCSYNYKASISAALGHLSTGTGFCGTWHQVKGKVFTNTNIHPGYTFVPANTYYATMVVCGRNGTCDYSTGQYWCPVCYPGQSASQKNSSINKLTNQRGLCNVRHCTH